MPSAILLDVAGVVVGTFAGCGMKKYISGSLNESINLALSVISAAVGVGLLGKAVHMSAAVLALLIGGIFLTAALLVVFIDERFQFIFLALQLRAFHPAEVQFSVGFLQRLPQSGVVPDRGDQILDLHVTPPF